MCWIGEVSFFDTINNINIDNPKKSYLKIGENLVFNHIFNMFLH